MADWVTISDTQVDPDAPITSELGYAFRDNPIAIAEGAVNAPRIRDNFGFATSNDLTNGMSFPLLGHNGVYGRFVFLLNATNGVSRNINIQFSSNDGGTWSAAETLMNLTADGENVNNFNVDTNISIDCLSGSARSVYNITNGTTTPPSSFTYNNNITIPGSGVGVNRIRFIATGGGAVSMARAHFKRNGGEY